MTANYILDIEKINLTVAKLEESEVVFRNEVQKYGRIVLYDGDVEAICQTLKRFREALRRIQELEAEKRKAP